MSEKQVIQQLNRIVKMLLQQTLPNKEVLNSKEVVSSPISEEEKMAILNPERGWPCRSL